MKSKKKLPFYKRAIYSLPQESNNYVVFLQSSKAINQDKIYQVVSCRNIHKYMIYHYDKKNLIINYFINTGDKVNIFSILNEKCNNINLDNKYYEIDSLNDIFELLKNQYNIEIISPIPNFAKNTQLICCGILMHNNENLIDHIRTCEKFPYTLFYEEVPKFIKKKYISNITMEEPERLKLNKNDTTKKVDVLNEVEIYKLPRNIDDYMIIIKNIKDINSKTFQIISISDFKFFKKQVILYYFCNKKKINFYDSLKSFLLEDRRDTYECEDMNKIYNILENEYNIDYHFV